MFKNKDSEYILIDPKEYYQNIFEKKIDELEFIKRLNAIFGNGNNSKKINFVKE